MALTANLQLLLETVEDALEVVQLNIREQYSV